MSDSLVFNSVDLADYGVTVLRSTLPGMPAARDYARQIGQSDGAVSAPRNYDSRTIAVDVLIEGTSFSNLLGRIDSIKSTLNEREACELTFDRQTGRYWNARGVLADIQHQSVLYATGQIEFFCADPFAYSSTESSHSETSVSVGVEGGSYTVTAAGTARAYPTIVFDSTGTATPLVIEHDAQDTRLVYTGAMASGDKIRIKTAPSEWTVERMPSGEDAYGAVMPYVDGQWPYLEIGDNIFTVYSFSGDITWTWRDRYL